MALVHDLPGPLAQLRLKAVHHVHAVGVYLRAADHDYISSIREIFFDALGHQGTHHLVVHRDVQIRLLPLDEPVVGDDLNSLVSGVLDLL